MPLPTTLLPTRVRNAEQSKEGTWLKSPADTAAYLSGGKWRHKPHLDYISDRLANIETNPVFLILNLPPRHGKSRLCSQWLPVWFLKKWPYKHVILCSYSAGFAAYWGGEVRNTIIANKAELDLEVSYDTKSKAEWRIKGYGGGMLSAGVAGPITGHGGDLLIIDDPIKLQNEALSETIRESQKQWYRSTFRPRAEPNASIILIMTRWHEDDLAGWVQSTEEEVDDDIPQDPWEVINIPALAEEDDPLGRKEGEALWPDRFDRNALAKLREAMGSYWFSAEYMGRPKPEGGNILEEAWFGYYTEEGNPLSIDVPIQHCIQIWDTAFEEGETHSRSACVTIIENRHGYYIMDVWAERVEFPELVKNTKAKYQQWLPERIYVEYKASGHSLVQQLRRDTKLPIIPVKAVGSKEARVHAISGTVEAGRVFLPTRAPWLSEFLHEVCTFPAAKTDDITDERAGYG
jgi:predicted phage terminase large subunit-like protein